MEQETTKQRIVAEAARLLRPGGHYGIDEVQKHRQRHRPGFPVAPHPLN